jgi:hypothetical protein
VGSDRGVAASIRPGDLWIGGVNDAVVGRDGPHGMEQVVRLGVFVWLSAPVLAFGATLAAGSEERATATYHELIGVVGFACSLFQFSPSQLLWL